VAEILGLAPDLTAESVRAAIATAVTEGTLPRRQFDPYISGLPYRGIQPGSPGSENFVWKVHRASLLALFCAQDCAVPLAEQLPPPTESKRGKPGRRGPVQGSVSRFGKADRVLFSEITRLNTEQHLTPNAAALRLAREGQVAETGTPESRARRLATLYIQERGKTP
jgi:hypothetical protein